MELSDNVVASRQCFARSEGGTTVGDEPAACHILPTLPQWCCGVAGLLFGCLRLPGSEAVAVSLYSLLADAGLFVKSAAASACRPLALGRLGGDAAHYSSVSAGCQIGVSPSVSPSRTGTRPCGAW